MQVKITNIDHRELNLIQHMKRIDNGEITVRIQNGLPMRILISTENIDLSKNEVSKT